MQGGLVVGDPSAAAGGRISLNSGSVFDRIFFNKKEKHSDGTLLISVAKKKKRSLFCGDQTMRPTAIIFSEFYCCDLHTEM